MLCPNVEPLELSDHRLREVPSLAPKEEHSLDHRPIELHAHLGGGVLSFQHVPYASPHSSSLPQLLPHCLGGVVVHRQQPPEVLEHLQTRSNASPPTLKLSLNACADWTAASNWRRRSRPSLQLLVPQCPRSHASIEHCIPQRSHFPSGAPPKASKSRGWRSRKCRLRFHCVDASPGQCGTMCLVGHTIAALQVLRAGTSMTNAFGQGCVC